MTSLRRATVNILGIWFDPSVRLKDIINCEYLRIQNRSYVVTTSPRAAVQKHSGDDDPCIGRQMWVKLRDEDYQIQIYSNQEAVEKKQSGKVGASKHWTLFTWFGRRKRVGSDRISCLSTFHRKISIGGMEMEKYAAAIEWRSLNDECTSRLN